MARVCAWCGRIHNNGEWRHADEIVANGEPGLLVGISHGICPECGARYCDALEEENPR